MNDPACIFCRIQAGEIPADIVHSDGSTITFLDRSPVFPGHLLIIPRQHVATLSELPDGELQPYFAQVRRATAVVESALETDGTFVAQNNKVSQTVPHLHFHVIPRKFKDGMKGFFWPRRPYTGDDHRLEVIERLKKGFADAR